MSEQADLRLAILIDADNVSYKKIEEILNEVKRYGVPTIKRIYGDWTNKYVENWKDKLLTHAITPIQQYSYTQGKNSTDSALIIDAMDILHTDRVDGFCIVSSDSDFTRLATRLRESGKLVIGIGEKKTPKSFIASCDKFIYVEIFEKAKPKTTVAKKKIATAPLAAVTNAKPTPVETETPAVLDEETLELLKDTVDDTADEYGWASLGEIGSLFNKRKPDFDARNYGYEKISHLFKAYKDDFEIDERNNSKSRRKHYYIRNIIKRANTATVAVEPSPAPESIPVQEPEPLRVAESVAPTSLSERTQVPTPTAKTKTESSNTQPSKSKTTASKSGNIQKPKAAKNNVSKNTDIPQETKTESTVTFPSTGNKITADDVAKGQIRITKELKPFFPEKSGKLKIFVKNNEFNCTYSYRKDRSNVIRLGKEAAEELGLTADGSLKITKLDDDSFKLEKL